jgi:transglutaminase/protease-like cytokinesis protein 3
MTLIFLVELTYKTSLVFQQKASTCTLSNAWNITYRYNYSFFNTYGKLLPKPRLFYIYSLIIPNSLNFFFRKSTVANFTRDFAEKLAATSRTGACEDFALGLTRLLRDSLHCQTRIVGVFGDQVDHALPEVKINDTWYILDIIFTTPNHPVKASDYATYLYENRRDIYQKIRNITDYDTSEDLRIEHGFINKG